MHQDLADLSAAADWFETWLTEQALPLWSTAGFDAASASFHEALDQAFVPIAGPRRSRVQTRQCWLFAEAARLGWDAKYLELARAAEASHERRYRREDGLFAYAVVPLGDAQDERALLYDQAFALLAWSALETTGAAYAAKAEAHKGLLAAHTHPAGGYRELGSQPFQANAHMHLLEASLAWEEAGHPTWRGFSDSIVELALARFIDREAGVLHEFFDADWTRLAGDEGLIEPGHQFEWAWLLDRWSQLRATDEVRPVAQALYATGLRGVDPARNVAVGSLWPDLGVRDPHTRVWPQTEWLKAALIFGTPEQALAAARALASFLGAASPGLWREHMDGAGDSPSGPAPATTLYHVFGAIVALLKAVGRRGG
jgi:mannose-1-phosphate guanylyltransferase / mannose-6-phosphate isomerase